MLRWTVMSCLLCVVGGGAFAQEATSDSEVASPDFGKLPWSDQQDKLGDLPARRLASARELLNLFNVDESHLAAFTDGQPLGAEDEETLVKILYRLPRFPLNDLHRWARSTDELSSIAELPEEHRCDVVKLHGRTTKIERTDLLPEAAERFEFDHYFRVTVQLDDAPNSILLCTRSIPPSWSSSQTRNQPVSASGLFLKLGETIDGQPEFVFATPRIAWHPDEVDEPLGVTNDHVYLASLGMDVGLFADVRVANRKPVRQGDRECFYQLLTAINDADAAAVKSNAHPNVDLAPLLQTPQTQHGRIMLVRGTARRVLEVRVDDEDIRERFGIDHYYQIDLFIKLKENEIVRLGGREDETNPTFVDSFPVTVCVLQLPPDLPASSDLAEDVAIPAVFFKLWSYRSRFVSAHDKRQRQVSPMFMGVTPSIVPPDLSTNPYVSLAVGGVFIGILAVAWLIVWCSGRSDLKFKRSILSRQFEVEPGKSLNDGKIVSRDEPDFSNLD
jgi:hypothetical protein